MELRYISILSLLCALIISAPSSSWAQSCVSEGLGLCSTPMAMDWDSTEKIYKFCDGTNWVSMRGDSTDGACTDEGALEYDTGDDRFEYCDGTNWIPIPNNTVLGACATAGEQEFDATNGVMKICHDTDYVAWLSANQLVAPTDGLIGHWKLDDGTGSSTAVDSAGGNNGTLTNMDSASDWVTGVSGDALDFDGSDDYVALGSSDIFDVGGAATWCNWFYSETDQSGRGMWSHDFDLSSNYKWIGGYLTTNSATIGGFVRISSTVYNVSSPNGGTGFYNNAWHHVCTTFDRTLGSQRLKLYVDGVLADTDNAADGDIDAGTNAAIGAWNNTTRFDGQLDDFRLYDRALSATEIDTLYKATRVPTEGGLLHHWKLDETSGTTVADSAGSEDGTTTNMEAGDWISGVRGNGLVFDGLNEYVTLTDMSGSSIDFSADFSISVWAKMDQFDEPDSSCTDDRAMIFVKENTANNRGVGLRSRPANNNQVQFVHGFTDNSSKNASHSGTMLTDQWYHIVGTYDTTAEEMQIFVNGILSDTTSTAGLTAYNPDGVAYIGGITKNCSEDHLTGTVDDLRIYDRELTAAEIETLYHSSDLQQVAQVPSLGLVGHWKLDETSGTNIVDSSPSGNDGTWTGSAAVETSTSAVNSGAVEFAAEDKYITMGDPADGSLDFGTGAFSFGGWVRVDGFVDQSSAAINVLFGKRASPIAGGWDFDINSSNNLRCNINQSIFMTANIADGLWHHVMCVRESGGTIRAYIDGAQVATTTNSGDISSSTEFMIGTSDAGASQNRRNIDGSIDDVRVYNRALSATEVEALYDSGTLCGGAGVTLAASCTDTPGDVCADGTVYAGTIDGDGTGPGGDVQLFVAPYDLDNSAHTAPDLMTDGTTDRGTFVHKVNPTDSSVDECDPLNNDPVCQDGQTLTDQLVNGTGPDGANTPSENHAAIACDNLNANGHTDWYLPSVQELDLIYDNLVVGAPDVNTDNVTDDFYFAINAGYPNGNYWSSSEGVNGGDAHYQDFGNGSQTVTLKFDTFAVRCARRE